VHAAGRDGRVPRVARASSQWLSGSEASGTTAAYLAVTGLGPGDPGTCIIILIAS